MAEQTRFQNMLSNEDYQKLRADSGRWDKLARIATYIHVHSVKDLVISVDRLKPDKWAVTHHTRTVNGFVGKRHGEYPSLREAMDSVKEEG